MWRKGTICGLLIGKLINAATVENSMEVPKKIERTTIWSKQLYFWVQFSSVQLLSRVRLFSTPWTTARQPSLSIINSQSLPKLMSIELVMPSNHLILCRPLLLLPSIFPSITVFSNESAPHIISHEEIENYSSNEVDETGAYYTEWSKPERKTPIQYTNAYIWNLERW